jgi:hypothetical protein
MQTIIKRAGSARAIAWGGGFALLWVVLAFARPTLTFHLAPFLVTAAPPVLLALDDGANASRGQVFATTTIGAGLALVVTAVLASAGRLDGAGLGPFSNALTEAIAFIGAGMVVGIGLGWWRVGRTESG